MKKKGLTLTVVMLAESANYGEGFGNIATLKKVSRGDHNQYTYISRQALRYNLIQQLGWDDTPTALQKKVVQFDPEATIDKYPEIDLFGYMKTKSKGDKGEAGDMKTRSAVARLSNAISLEPYNGDMDFLTNMGLARRFGFENGIAQSEIHASYYSYTVTIDLDRVGVEEIVTKGKGVERGERKAEPMIQDDEKAKRVGQLLDAIMFLYRDIKGRRENLMPLFVIGGVYARKNPYFMHRISVKNNVLNVDSLAEVKDFSEDTMADNTLCGVQTGIFKNEDEIKDKLGAKNIAEFFAELKNKVNEQYGV